MIAGNEEHPSDFRQGLAAASQPLWLYVAGWLVVALDLKYTRTTTIGVSVSSCSLDVLPDVLGVCMMAAAIGRIRRAARGLGSWSRSFDRAQVVLWIGAPLALPEFAPAAADSIWLVPTLMGLATGMAELAVYRAMSSWTREADIPNAAIAWRVIGIVTVVSLAMTVLGVFLRLARRRLDLGFAGMALTAGVLVVGVVAIVYAVRATTGHPDVRRRARSNPSA